MPHLKHSVLLAKLLAPHDGHFQSPGLGSFPPPLPPLSPKSPPLPPPIIPLSSFNSPRAAFLRLSRNQSGVPLSELLLRSRGFFFPSDSASPMICRPTG